MHAFFIHMLYVMSIFIEIALLSRDLEATELLYELLLHDRTSNFYKSSAGKMQTRITPNSNTFYAVHAMDQIDEGHLETFHLFSSIFFPVCLSVKITRTGRSMTFKMSKNNERKLLSPLPLSL